MKEYKNKHFEVLFTVRPWVTNFVSLRPYGLWKLMIKTKQLSQLKSLSFRNFNDEQLMSNL